MTGPQADNHDLGDLTDADAPGRFRVRVLLLLALCAVVLTWVEGVNFWPRLPDRMPTHFGMTGAPDGWSGKGTFAVFGMLIVAAGMLAIFAFICSRACSPTLYNFPGKERMLRFPRPKQEYVVAPLREGLAWMGALVAIALCVMLRQSWEVALGSREALFPWTILVAIAMGSAAVIVGIVQANRRAEELTEPS